MAKKKITQLDLFSGIGGFHLGFEKAGFKVKSYFSEIDKHAIAVYKHQFKNAEYVGSVIDIDGNKLPRIDLITFGSPCQDFSLAGKRKGMEGERSSLVLEAIRLIDECRPSVFIWENVKGTFSSNNGADFAAILQAFANIGGYRLEWQLLNTSWVLPQNRERVYLVGYSTKPGRNWRGVFPITKSDRSDSELECSRKAVTKCLTARGQEGHAGMQLIKVKSATKAGYETAEEGDSINLSNPNSKTRRGRVGKGKAQTLDTGANQAVVQPYQNIEIGDIRYDEGGFRPRKNGIAPALVGSNNKSGTPNCSILKDNTTYRIRRLTPIECERLQGFPDNHTEYGIYDGEVKKMSNTQRYKQCGNAVTVDIVALVAEAVKPLFK
jgi:DNA (cytosine-5)-methyltransferase 1